MQMMGFMVVSLLCLLLLRSAWRLLVEIPDAHQVWVPDAVEAFLSRSISALLLGLSALFLILMAHQIG